MTVLAVVLFRVEEVEVLVYREIAKYVLAQAMLSTSLLHHFLLPANAHYMMWHRALEQYTCTDHIHRHPAPTEPVLLVVGELAERLWGYQPTAV